MLHCQKIIESYQYEFETMDDAGITNNNGTTTNNNSNQSTIQRKHPVHLT